jgi:hypothetical protein
MAEQQHILHLLPWSWSKMFKDVHHEAGVSQQPGCSIASINVLASSKVEVFSDQSCSESTRGDNNASVCHASSRS